MSYGRGEYGQAGYGGSSFETGGPSLVSSDPVNGATGIFPTATISFHLHSPAGLDQYSLSVQFDDVSATDQYAISGGAFQSGYTGSLIFDPAETDMLVTLSGHPVLLAGPLTVDIEVTDLAGNPGSFSFTFDVVEAIVEAVTITEAAAPSAGYHVTASESLTLNESIVASHNNTAVLTETLQFVEILDTGAPRALDASSFRVSFPLLLRFDGISDLSKYSLTPITDAAPAFLTSVESVFDVLRSGSAVFALPPEYANDAGTPPRRGSLADATTNILDFGSVVFTTDNIGDYIQIQNGADTGWYRIIDTTTTSSGPTRQRVYLDGLISLGDPTNGYVEGLLEVLSTASGTVTFKFTHPQVTPSDGLVEIITIFDRELQNLLFQPAVTFDSYNTFTVTTGLSFTTRTVVRARVSPKVQWQHTTAIEALIFRTNNSPGTKLTLEEEYLFEIRDLFTREGAPFALTAAFKVIPPAGFEQQPKVLSATFLPTEGIVLVEFDQEMRVDDANLGNLKDYSITGPSVVQVKQVISYNPTTVALHTAGMIAGDYTLTVSTNTPKDVAGNPIDPTFNSVIFTAATPETIRSIFTDKGPIAKPPLVLQTGVHASLQTYNEVTLPGASLNAGFIGNYVTLSGGSLNGGTFRISSVLSATRARLANTSFTLPDPDSGSLAWVVFDPRHGQVADDPSDVTVRINGTPVTPEAVVGLLGQIVLSDAPIETDDVKVDYSWVLNPTVEFRQLNSREFRLNSWNRDLGYPRDKSRHKYRYNNVLVRPGEYDPDDPSAVLDQPLSRELHYRAYERAYTPVLNDPSLLLLNSPIHRIAFPPAQRTLAEEFVTYEGIGLPESQTVDPWVKKGSGTASSAAGHLTVIDNSTGPYPTGQPFFWTRPIDLTFPHVFAMSWRFTITSQTPDGIFTGIAAGFSDDKVALVVGYLLDGSTKKMGILKRGFGDNPSTLTAWTGGIDSSNTATGLPADMDWDVLHSYRIFQDRNGTIQVFVDGEIVERLRVSPGELPFLEELSGPFDEIQGAFFGSLSRPAQNASDWDFVRYLIQPTNPKQTASATFVNYEGNVLPEQDSKPWTPVGFHGVEAVQSSLLLLSSTSATDAATAAAVGLVDGDYKGFVRFEPLLTVASEVVLDVQVQLLTFTHGVSPYGLTFAVDDGQRLMQVAFLSDRSFPKVSYGGRSFPQDFAPYNWQILGTQPAAMVGRVLRIEDSSVSDGLVYFLDDTAPVASDDRIFYSNNDYIVEFRCRVNSFTVDGVGFAGAFAQAYDSARSVGVLFEVVSGTRYISFHSDGTTLGPSARFAFDWGDGNFHTYRITKNTVGNLISLFADGSFMGAFAYSSFLAPTPDPIGQLSFGSSTPASSGALSIVDWAYVNGWRLRPDMRFYVGLWKGTNSGTFLDYHLPLKASGKGATANGNALGDGNANFITQGVVSGDLLVVDTGPNQGVYEIGNVVSGTVLTFLNAWPAQPTLVDYRILAQTNWTNLHKYRLFRDSSGNVNVFVDSTNDAIISVGYNSIDLPESGVGIIKVLGNGLPTIAFGSFDPQNLEQSQWDFVRYGITRSATDLGAAPHHQVLNQWNVMESPERLFTILPHELTSFKSSSTGIVPKKDPDFLADPGLPAFTQLNQDTPLVPQTQTFEVRAPYPIEEFVSALNQPEDVLNNDGNFVTNDGTKRFRLIVPDDVLYTSLDIIEQATGTDDLLAPFTDEGQPNFGGFQYQKEVCLTYDGSVLPENDPSAPTPWQLVSDNPGQVSVSVFGGALTYGTGGSGTRTVYRNNTPLPDHPSLINEIKFTLKLINDTTGGTGETQVMFGFSAPGMTVGLTFYTSPLGDRFVQVVDLNNNNVLGSASFDFLDNNFHMYRILRDPGQAVVQVFIDS